MRFSARMPASLGWAPRRISSTIRNEARPKRHGERGEARVEAREVAGEKGVAVAVVHLAEDAHRASVAPDAGPRSGSLTPR